MGRKYSTHTFFSCWRFYLDPWNLCKKKKREILLKPLEMFWPSERQEGTTGRFLATLVTQSLHINHILPGKVRSIRLLIHMEALRTWERFVTVLFLVCFRSLEYLKSSRMLICFFFKTSKIQGK